MAARFENHARIGKSPLAGEGLFATRDIGQGELITSFARPLFAVLDLSWTQNSCGHCFRGTNEPEGLEAVENVFFCTGCKRIKYCSKSCQSQSWKRSHKFECKLYNVRDPPPLPSSVRLALQIILMKNYGTLTDDETQAIERMARVHNELDGPSESLLAGKQAISDLISFDKKSYMMSRNDVETLFDLILTNTLTLVHPMMDDMGIVLDPFISKANHSCQPNATVIFDGCIPSIRSTRPIAKDEEICQSYTDFTFHRSMRQAKLSAIYGFDCACVACTSTEAEDQNELSDVMKDLYAANERAHRSKKPAEAIPLLKAIIRTAQDHRIPITRQPIPDAYQLLMMFSNLSKDFRTALLILIKLYFLIDPVLYPQRFFVTRVIHTWTLLQIMMQFSLEYQDRNDPDGYKREWGIDDIMVPLWKIMQTMKVDAPKSHGPGRFTNLVNNMAGHVDRMLSTAPPRVQQYIKDDPGDIVWKQFERLKHNKIDLTGATTSLSMTQS